MAKNNVSDITSKSTDTSVPPVEAPKEKIASEDQQALQVAGLTKQVAVKTAEAAASENKAAELAYRYLVLQLYMKYNMTAEDALDESGNIHRGANKPKAE